MTSLIANHLYRCVLTPAFTISLSYCKGKDSFFIQVISDWSHWEYYHYMSEICKKNNKNKYKCIFSFYVAQTDCAFFSFFVDMIISERL